MSTAPKIEGLRITRVLGRGGMGTVYAAIEVDLDREVAVKVIEVDQPEQHQEMLARAAFEARSLAKLRHPHIVELYRFGKIDDGRLYYVMPLLTGGDLSTWPKPQPEARVRVLMESMLDALAHAHDAGLIHRDVKPENILFDAQGRPLLADFGAVLVLDNETRLTQEGFSIGSVGSMSPEQARGLPLDVTSDLYSLAVVCYELLCGYRPHTGADALALALAQMESAPAALPVELRHWQKFFTRALAAEPKQRFPDAATMKAALPQSNTSVTIKLPVVRAAKVNKWLALGLGFALGAICLSMLLRHQRGQAEARFQEAVQSLANLQKPAWPELLQHHQDALALADSNAQKAKVVKATSSHLLPELTAANSNGSFSRLLELWRALSEVIDLGQLEPFPELKLARKQSERRVEESLRLAIDTYDRESAQSALPIADLLLPESSKSLLDAARTIPAPGERFRLRELELVLVSAPKLGAAGLAVMAEPLRADAEFKLQGLPTCVSKHAFVGCLNRARAQDLLTQLAKETGLSLELPSPSSWAIVHRQVPQFAGLQAQSSECNSVRRAERRNAVQRAWGGFKRAVGGRDQVAQIQFCQGDVGFPLDGSGASRVIEESDANTVLLLLVKLDLAR
jgi:serine/threonine protein kinase